MVLKLKTIIGKIQRADKDYKMFKDGDKVMVGISGGKDSMLLANALLIYQKVLKEKDNINIELIACHVKQNFCVQDYDGLIKYFDSIGLPFELVDSEISKITLNNRDKNGKVSCSLCSKLRKGILVDKALQLKCNKIAMGHHGDDAVETLIMNITRGGRIATFLPVMHLDRKDMLLVRPMVYVREKEIIYEVKRNNIPVSDCGCPNVGFTERDVIREKLNAFYAKQPNEDMYKNLLSAIHNEKEVKLWNKKDED